MNGAIIKFTKLSKELKKNAQRSEMKELFAHLLAAQNVWMSRIEKNPISTKIWPETPDSEIEELVKKNPERLKRLIPGKNKIIHYKNSKGDSFQSSVEEILMHLVIHGQHHRAQISKLLRHAGIEPPVTDLIYYLRE